MNPPSAALRDFNAGFIFVCINLIFILIQTIPLQIPRLGDDSPAYLAKKTKVDTGYSRKTPIS
jgi:hypothetical protein